MIEARLSRRYGAAVALDGASFTVRAGTVHALVGENGAGKSTLVKILAGVVRGEGTLAIDNEAIDLGGWERRAARARGIGIVQQHGASAGTLTVVENAVLGVEPRRAGLLALDRAAAAIAALGDKLGMPVDPHARVEDLSLGAAQRAEIVAALHHGAKLLVLDEPTAVLAPVEVAGLLARLRELAASGTTIVIVTHKLDEVREVADDVTVLRAGKTVAVFTAGRVAPTAGDAYREPAERLDIAAIARAMVGADLPEATQVAAPASDAAPALVVSKLTAGALRGIDLAVRTGEIVGVAGVDGNGQRELALAIAGLCVSTGTVAIAGRDVTRASPAVRFAAGLAHVPEDRHHGGLVIDASIAENLALGRADIAGTFRIDHGAVARHAAAQIAALDIRPPDPAAIVRALSGGNQQKVVIGRELSRPKLAAVVAAQPTRGVDLGAVARIHERLRAAATSGAGVLVISADLDELLALCHRVVVLLRGRIVGEGRDRAALGALMTGAGAAA